MTKKIYRSAQGRQIDIGALQLQNENTRAVGNMGVNARGDLVDGWNRPIHSRNQQVARQYARQTNVSDAPVQTRAENPRGTAPQARPSNRPPGLERPQRALRNAVSDPPPQPPEDFDDDFQRSSQDPAAQGLAAAIARAQSQRNKPRR